MGKFLVRVFIKNYEDTQNPEVRKKYGMLAGVFGIFCNIMLSVLKIVIGVLSGAFSIVGDAVNNMSDAASSIITLISFKLSGKPADKEHPSFLTIRTQIGYESVSGLGGPELFRELGEKLEKAVAQAEELLDAERIEPGEYEIITSPEVSGLIAHEAFGHGVEMDMFVKNRALGREYVGRRVGSELVTMHEGALCAENVTSYAFDDEGTLAGDVVEIEKGILRTGICDALSALRLGVKPTGNGKRENFEHKVYTRMTNTIFDSGTDTLEDMIASVEHGYLLDGRLTGKIVAPIIMTGYVPDLLGNISMCSRDREVFGAGGCGQGYKEWVKVSDGGPYLKTKARLG